MKLKSIFAVCLLLLLSAAAPVAFAQGTPGTIRFPTQLDTPDSLFRTKDAPRTTLLNSLTPFSSSITSSSGGTASFDSSGSIKIDDEIIVYTSKTSNQFLGLTRGACGSTAASHAVGVVIRSPILSCHHNTLGAAIIETQTKIKPGASASLTNSLLFSADGVSSAWVQQPAIDCTNCTGSGSGFTGLTKAQVGLGNVDNTSDANKPISTAVQAALALKGNVSGTGTTNKVPKFTNGAGGVIGDSGITSTSSLGADIGLHIFVRSGGNGGASSVIGHGSGLSFLQLRGSTYLSTDSSAALGQNHISQNATFNNALTSVYTETGFASNYYQSLGTHNWRVTPSGTAAGAITWLTPWQISNLGHLISPTDNTYDIGASGATRPRSGYFGTSLVIGSAASIKSGTGSPEGVTTSAIGSLWLRTDGSGDTYRKESGAGNTGWVAVGAGGGGGGLGDPGSNGLVKRTALNTTTSATAGTDYVKPDTATTYTGGLQDFGTANLALPNRAGAPGSPVPGQIYRDTANSNRPTYCFDSITCGALLTAGLDLVDGANIQHTVNSQTGTSYTVANGDRGKLITHSNGSATAYTLPQAGAGSPALFVSGWYADFHNRGAGTITITPTTSTIDGGASLPVTQGQGVRIFSDGTNYFTQRGMGSGGGGGTPGGSDLQAQYNNAGAFGGLNLFRLSADELEQRNGTTGQATYIYQTYTSPTNFRRTVFFGSGLVKAEAGASANGEDLVIRNDSGGSINIGTNGASKWILQGTNTGGTRISALEPVGDAAYDLGSSGTRVRVTWTTIVCYTATVCDFAGTGTPESVVTAGMGSTYRNLSGGANVSLYTKESGTGNTGWVAK